MKVFISYILLLALVLSCEQYDETKGTDFEREEMYLNKILEGKCKEIYFFDDECLEEFEKYFKYSGIWPREFELIEGCHFTPEKSNVNGFKGSFNDYSFVGFFNEYRASQDSSVEQYFQIYASDEKLNTIIPLEIHSKNFTFDSTKYIELYLGGGMKCGDLYLNGTKYSDTSKLGVYETVDSPEMNRYVDSVLRVKNSQNN